MSSQAIEELLGYLDSPTIMHDYGAPPPEFGSDRVWMQYAPVAHQTKDGGIAFSRNTLKHAPQLVRDAYEYLGHYFPVGVLNPHWIHIIRTYGDVVPHVDENRKTCVNIGVANSTAAVTWCVPTEGTLEEFDKTAFPFQCQNGAAYLLDVSRPHAVKAAPGKEKVQRLLITHSFGKSFGDLYDAHLSMFD